MLKPRHLEYAEKYRVLRKISPQQVKDMVCDHFGIKPEILDLKSRKREHIHYRQITLYLLRHLTKKSYQRVGNMLAGHWDHASVMHACGVIDDLIDIDKEFRIQLNTFNMEYLKII